MNRILTICILAAGVVCTCQPTTAEGDSRSSTTQQSMSSWKMICLGDGLTAGVGVEPEAVYPAVLQTQLMTSGHRVKIVNAGIKGETVQRANERVEWILQQQLDAILFAVGCQDQLLEHEAAAVLTQWEALLSKVRRAYPAIPVFIAIPCAKDGAFTQADFYTSLQEQFDVSFLPLNLQGGTNWWSANLDYLTVAGQAELARQIRPFIERIVPPLKE